MLVIQRLRRDERGSTIVTVLIVMLTLSVLAVTLGSLVIGTTQAAVSARGSIQAKAAADAGLSAAIATAKRTGDPCTVALSEPDAPAYDVTAICTANEVTFTSIGTGVDGGVNTVEAVYEFTTEPGAGDDMIFYGNTTFTNQVLTYPLDTDLLSIVIPTGNFTCMSTIPANIMLSGNFITQGNCDVEGSVIAGGTVDMTNAPDTVRGTLTAAGTGSSTVRGKVLGNLFVGGPLTFGWNNRAYPGSVQAGGSTDLTSDSIVGGLTVPSGSQLKINSSVIAPTTTSHARVGGGIARPASVTPPPAPTFDPWFDYSFSASDWPGYAVRTLANSGSGPNTCGYFNNWPATGWHELANVLTPTVIDARACGSLSANSGTEPTVTIKTNLVFMAKSFDLTKLTFNAAASADPKVWWVVPDTNANSTPTCSGGAGNVTINHTVMSQDITAMAYTPCVVSVHGNSQWTGSFYGGSFNYGGGMTFHGDPIALPGMPSATGGGGGAAGTIGNLVSKRDTVTP